MEVGLDFGLHFRYYINTMNEQTLEETIKANTPPTEAPEQGKKWVKNLISGKWIQIDIDTPYCCDPSMERYWSM